MAQRPLGQFEQAFTLTNEAYGLVAVGVLRLQPGPSPPVLRQALDALQARHPLLRMVVAPRGRAFAFVPMEPPGPVPLRVIARQGDAHWQRLAEHLLNQRFDPARGPLMRCVYLVAEAPAPAAELICVFHHAVIDAASGARLCHELLSRCAALVEKGAPAQAQSAPLALQPPTEALLPPAYRGGRLVRRLLPFLAGQVREQRRYRKQTRHSHQPPILPQSTCCILSLTVPEAATGTLIRKARRERVSLNSALAAAMLLVVYRHRYPPEARRLRTLVFADLRPYLRPALSAEHLGCYLAMQRLAVPVSPQTSLWRLARSLGEDVYASNKRGEKYLAALLSKRLMRRLLRKQDERMAATALSYAGPLRLDAAYGAIAVTGVHGFITSNRLGPEYSAFAHLAFGRLRLDFMYMAADMDAGQARAIAVEIERILTEQEPSPQQREHL